MASKDADERCDAVGELACLEPIPKRAITALVRALRDPSEEVRVEVADALEEARVKAAVAPLLDALARARTRRSRKLWPNADETSSLVCALAACGSGEPRVVKALASQLALRGNVYATRAALESLAEMKRRAKAAVPALEALFDDKDAWLRAEARRAVIAITGDHRPHVPAFVELLDHATAAVSAQRALGSLGKRAMPSLRAARQHPRPRVRKEVSKLLRQIGT
jgi:HEAT repeat protein